MLLIMLHKGHKVDSLATLWTRILKLDILVLGLEMILCLRLLKLILCYEFYLLDLGCVFLALNFCSVVSQDYMAHGSQGLFTQVGFNDPSQDDASQSHFGIANPNSLQSQVSSSSYPFNILKHKNNLTHMMVGFP